MSQLQRPPSWSPKNVTSSAAFQYGQQRAMCCRPYQPRTSMLELQLVPCSLTAETLPAPHPLGLELLTDWLLSAGFIDRWAILKTTMTWKQWETAWSWFTQVSLVNAAGAFHKAYCVLVHAVVRVYTRNRTLF